MGKSRGRIEARQQAEMESCPRETKAFSLWIDVCTCDLSNASVLGKAGVGEEQT